jgi:hypothetical protein
MDKFLVFAKHIGIDIEKQAQGFGDVAFSHVAEVRGDRMGRFRNQRAQLKLAAKF